MDEKRAKLKDEGVPRYQASDMAWKMAMAEFPPPGCDPPVAQKAESPPAEPVQPDPPTPDLPGLYAIPSDWPPLPDNASLQQELGWVQSQRLAVVEERGNTTAVHLERASSPAPSKAALAWLESSVRSYAKYLDILAKAMAGAVDEQESVRRERMRIEDIASILSELRPTGRCPTCGQVIEG